MRLLACSAIVLLALAGCKNREKDLVGAWTATQAGGTMKMTVKEDKTWTADLMAAGRSIPYVGNWKFKDDVLTLTPTSVGGKTIAEIRAAGAKLPSGVRKNLEEMVKADDFTLSSDGKTLTLKNPKAGQPVLAFTKG